MRTGTLAEATFERRSRCECMASELPKTIASGGMSPSDCTKELTEFVTVAAISALRLLCHKPQVHPRHQTVNHLALVADKGVKVHHSNGLRRTREWLKHA